jgi:hypothetical protein
MLRQHNDARAPLISTAGASAAAESALTDYEPVLDTFTQTLLRDDLPVFPKVPQRAYMRTTFRASLVERRKAPPTVALDRLRGDGALLEAVSATDQWKMLQGGN